VSFLHSIIQHWASSSLSTKKKARSCQGEERFRLKRVVIFPSLLHLWHFPNLDLRARYLYGEKDWYRTINVGAYCMAEAVQTCKLVTSGIVLSSCSTRTCWSMNLSRGLLELLALEALSLPFLIELLLVLAYWTGFRLRLNAYWKGRHGLRWETVDWRSWFFWTNLPRREDRKREERGKIPQIVLPVLTLSYQ